MSNAELAGRILAGIGGFLFFIEGIAKLAGKGIIFGMTTPCGLAMLLLGLGVLILVITTYEEV